MKEYKVRSSQGPVNIFAANVINDAFFVKLVDGKDRVVAMFPNHLIISITEV